MRETPLRQAAGADLAPVSTVGLATYTVPEFAQIMQCSQRHVWRQIDAGHIPGVIRCGRLVRLSRAVIDRWLAGERRAGN